MAAGTSGQRWEFRSRTRLELLVLLALLVTTTTTLGARAKRRPARAAQHQQTQSREPRELLQGTLMPRDTSQSECYDSYGRPQRCIPPFENAAFGVLIEATNTCGQDGHNTVFCKQTGVRRKACEVCHEGDHPAKYLTDRETSENATWWQSETMDEGIQYPNQVNLTLHLGKTFDITYVRVLFESPRPESWGIFKRKHPDAPWEPYQYYSASCRDTYNLPDTKETTHEDNTRVLCTSEYSDIVPLSRGTVAFSTLEGRPSAYNFGQSQELQEWVQATDLKIILDRLNTFGDEVFGDENVLKTYYYAIDDIAVGARCACNGHASECINATASEGGRAKRVCRCEHNTAGPDCNECLPFYNDAPWGRATTSDAHECKPCNCNGYSERCYFDEELYKAIGHGGHCMDCRDNRAGANCEKCRENYYARAEDAYCVPCMCNEIGSRSLQCNAEGKCQCKPGVTGDKCDRCATNHFDFGTFGCTSCSCEVAGSLANTPSCDPVTGTCVCKENVEGKRCRACRPGFFNLAVENEFGCTPCFCYGHSALCSAASGYSRVTLESAFVRGIERWAATVAGVSAPVHYDPVSQSISVSAPDRDNVYFVAPERFLGDQRASYNQDLSFVLRISDSSAAATSRDLILEGGNGEQIIQPIFGQKNLVPSTQPLVYTFRLHEHPNYGWLPRLNSRNFISILSNLTAIKVRGTYSHQGKGYLDDFRLETALRGAAGEPADWVEHCNCPQGYVGQFCESCAPGYHHFPPNGGPFSSCIPCNCNGHADICEAETGQCICQHNTAGSNCEHCARGFYGHPLRKTPDDCQPCPCPDNGPCILLGDNPDPICSECPIGRTGPRCETCSDGYFGNPEQGIPCKPCECNNNIDLNAVRNCNQETGDCLKCVNNTAGKHCEECLGGYYGDALSDNKEDGCKPCQCYRLGTLERSDGGVAPCDQLTGHCYCKPNVIGRNCDKCEDGFYNIKSGEGCTPCNCDIEGSYNRTCDTITGQCQCRPGIDGRQCDHCLPLQYGFSRDGCKPCNCDNHGSQDEQCDAEGQCPCLPNVEGRTCDRCKENKYNRQFGCIDCPPCYNLVQEAVNKHRSRLAELQDTLKRIRSSPTVINEQGFIQKLTDVQNRVKELYDKTKEATGSEQKSLVEQLADLSDRLDYINETLKNINQTAGEAKRTTQQGRGSIDEAEKVLDKIHDLLSEAEDYLATEGQNALNEARKRGQQVGEQNQQMTIIAEEARSVANANVEEAKRLQNVAELAKNTSMEAYNLAKNTIKKYLNISDEIRYLENKLTELEERFDDVKRLIGTAAKKSETVSKEALDLLVLKVSIPAVNTTELRNRVDIVNEEATKIRDRAKILLEDNSSLIKEVNERVRSSEELLKKAQEQQDKTAELLSEVDEANKIAKDAVTRGENTLSEAKDILTKLSEFDNLVQEARDKAQKALGEIQQIKDLIEDAESKSNEIHGILLDAEQNAILAKNITQKAQESASNASTSANEIREEAMKTKAEVIKLGNEADKLHLRVNSTEAMVKEHEIRVLTEANETNEVKQKVGQAKSNVTTASAQVAKALEEVAEIIKELESLPDINNADLDGLEERLRLAESDIEKAGLDQRIRTLTEAKNLQTQWVKNYEEEVRELRSEVENINEIRKVLPNECYKHNILEP